MKKQLFTAIAMLSAFNMAFAQNEDDVLKYTNTFIPGTARSQGAAGAFGSIGSDFSSTAINPAGLGLYRRNEVVFGTAITANQSNTKFFGSNGDDRRTNFNIPTWGMVFTKVFSDLGEDRKVGLVSVSIGAGMNRVSSYQSNVYFNGTNTTSSILDYFKRDANGNNVNNFGDATYRNSPGAIAWGQYLLDTSGTATNYRSLIDGTSNFQLKQTQQQNIRGAANEYNISSGINLSNIVYLGAGLIISQAYSESVTTFTETDQNNSVPDYTSVTFKQKVKSDGSGVSGRFGIIVRPVDFLKLGFGVQTPGRLNMRDDYSYEMGSVNTNPGNTTGNPSAYYKPGTNDFINYQVIMPGRLTGSASVTIPSMGFVSVDYESIDYSNGKIKSDNFSFDDVNNRVSNNMKRAGNLRIGAEFKIADYYRLRGGYAVYESPYKNTGGVDLNRYAITGGFGLVVDRVFVDFAVVSSYGKQYISPYTTGDASRPTPTAENNYNIYNFVLSGGIRF
jgi:hypothetical protein